MLRRFFKDSVIYGTTSVITRGMSLILLLFLTRVLTPTDYGIVDLLVAFAAFVNLTVALEISQGLARYFTEAETADEKTEYVSTALWFTIAAYTLFAIIAYVATPVLATWILETPTQDAVFQVAVLSIWANGIYYLAQNQLRWELQPRLYAVASLAFALASIGLTVLFVLVLNAGVIGVFYGQLGGYVAGAGLSLYFARHRYKPILSGARLREMLAFSLPLVPSSIAVFVAGYVDRLAIKELMSLGDVGMYGVAYRLASVVSLAMVGFQGALTPLVWTHHREPSTPAQLARIFRYFVALALSICLALAVFSREIVALIAPPEYAGAASVLPILPAAVIVSGMYIFAPGLFLAKNTKAIGVINVAVAALNVALNVALIPYLGIAGSALATLVSAGGGFVVLMIMSQRFYPVPHAWRKIAWALLAAVAVGVGGLILPHNSTIDPAFLVALVGRFTLLAVGMGVVVLVLIGRNEVVVVGRRLFTSLMYKLKLRR